MAKKTNTKPVYDRYTPGTATRSTKTKSNDNRMLLCSVLIALIVVVAGFFIIRLLATGGNSGTDNIDVDLSRLSKTVATAQITQINNSPENYAGKTVKISGQYSYNNGYPMVSVGLDSTGCCNVGLEFVSNSGYPAENANVTVVGTLRIYYENNVKYCHLVNTHFE